MYLDTYLADTRYDTPILCSTPSTKISEPSYTLNLWDDVKFAYLLKRPKNEFCLFCQFYDLSIFLKLGLSCQHLSYQDSNCDIFHFFSKKIPKCVPASQPRWNIFKTEPRNLPFLNFDLFCISLLRSSSYFLNI